MSSTASGYDLLASQFSPDGRIFQIDYAQKAADKSGTIIALRGKDCVVFGVENLAASKLYEVKAHKKIYTIDGRIGMAIVGFYADGRHVVQAAENESRNFRQCYHANITPQYLKTRVCMYMHAYTLYGAMRPFGINVIMGSYENNVPRLLCIEASGICYDYFGCAVGKGREAAKTEIGNLKLEDLTPTQLVREAARIIYAVHDEEKDKHFELELSWVGKHTGGKHKFVPKIVFEDAENYAKASLTENDSGDDI